MAMVAVTKTRTRRARAATDPYSTTLRTRAPTQIDPYQFPTGSLAGLEDLGDGTGIDFIDENVKAMRAQLDEATLAARITAGCAVLSAVGSIFLITRGRR